MSNPIEIFGKLSQPAHRALANAGITKLEQLSQLTEKELLKLHGIGKSIMPQLREKLAAVGLNFKS